MTRRSLVLPVVIVVLCGAALASCSSDGDDTSSSTSTTASSESSGEGDSTTPLVDAPTGTLAEVDCWWDLGEIEPDVTVTCHTLTVPADWADPDGGDDVVLPVARLHREGVADDAVPIVVLHGGPGGDLLGAAPTGVASGDLVADRDVILYDQRGSGRSEPSLNCPEKEAAVMGALQTVDSVEDELARNVEATQACRDRLVGEGIDLADYNTLASVNDLDALRDAFELETWNVTGASYGTRIGLAYARQHPDRVRALVLDSVYPPQAGSRERIEEQAPDALQRLVDDCSADAACGAIIDPCSEAGACSRPMEIHLGDLIETAAASLDEAPGEATLALAYADRTADDEPEEYRLVGSDFRSGMFAALYDTSIIPLMPGIIDGVAAGDRGIVPTFLETATPRLTGLSEGAYLSIDCADSGRLLEGATAEDLVGDGDFFVYSMVLAQPFCEQWDVAPLPASFNEPALPDVPTLVYGGTLDPITPFPDSEEQAQDMPDARFVAVPRGGHGVATFDDCTIQARTEFLADPSSDLPACTADIAGQPYAS